ncbi:hypothetical protein K2173_014029 [Erythroxylum novogranatense]|uniref:Uncharacterized protein n=1 Tax=Erythroxylum novogranatense TaxID=1862640 RepID=A0AAV8SDA4_9ROSI|nr:hypothetical protein K2173_014029 [Erythroxylum novogranatense]
MYKSMTVKETAQGRLQFQPKYKDFLLPHRSMDQSPSLVMEDRCAFENSESSMVVGKWKQEGFMHSQVLRIKEEDSHLGEDFTEGWNYANKENGSLGNILQLRRVVFFPRQVLPCSPLRVVQPPQSLK